MHRVAEDQTIRNAALCQALLDLPRDVDECSAGGHFKPQFFAIAFHELSAPPLRIPKHYKQQAEKSINQRINFGTIRYTIPTWIKPHARQ